MSLDAKLVALARPVETTQLKELVGRPASLITGARKVNTRYGKTAVVLDIKMDDLATTSVFLPSKYGELEDAELDQLTVEGYKLLITANDGSSTPNIQIFK